MPMERTLVLIKPDGMQRGLAGEIISRLERRGLRIAALRLFQMDDETARAAFVDVLRSSDPEMRAAAARALGGGHVNPWPWPQPRPMPRPFP